MTDAGLDNAAIVARNMRLQLIAKKAVTEMKGSGHRSVVRGQGMEFDEVRSYVPGDDVRMIDWNVSARFDSPFVKLHRAEHEAQLLIVLDVSGSLRNAENSRQIFIRGLELCAVFAWIATLQGDPVGLICFSDKIEEFIPPRRSGTHSVIGALNRYAANSTVQPPIKNSAGLTSPKCVADFFAKAIHRRGMVMFVSDFIGEGFADAINRIAVRHDLIRARLFDRTVDQTQKRKIGLVSLVDSETGDHKDIFIREGFGDTETRNKTKSGVICGDVNIRDTIEKNLESILKFRQ